MCNSCIIVFIFLQQRKLKYLDRMGNRQTSHLVNITEWKWDPDKVYVILYHYDLTKNTTLNYVSTTISESVSG